MSDNKNAAIGVGGVDLSGLFEPLVVGQRTLKNRIVMAPMTRAMSPDGVPGPDVAEYYRLRAAGGVGLIVTEGTWVPHGAASNDPMVPRFYGDDALAGWEAVVNAVHSEGALIIPQLWHIGMAAKTDVAELYSERSDARFDPVGPSGITPSGTQVREPMTASEIADVQQAYVDAATSAYQLGFDGIELHGAHGYLLDQFFWAHTNRRHDAYGGDYAGRASFVAEIVAAIRARTAAEFLISLRFSQWKMEDYQARAWPNVAALESFLQPLSEAGVDLFHCSQRRYWEPEFEGSNLNLAGWAQKLTGKPAISVGSVGIDVEFLDTLLKGAEAHSRSLADLAQRMSEGEFALIAIGRALIANPEWPTLIQSGDVDRIRLFTREMLTSLL